MGQSTFICNSQTSKIKSVVILHNSKAMMDLGQNPSKGVSIFMTVCQLLAVAYTIVFHVYYPLILSMLLYV